MQIIQGAREAIQRYTMSTQNVTTAIILDKRSPKKDGSFPLKLRVTYLRKQKYYSINESLTNEAYQRVIGPRPRKEYKTLAIKFASIEQKARNVIKQIPSFSFGEFEDRFLQHRSTSNDLFDHLADRAEELIAEDRIRTAEPFRLAAKSIGKFLNRKKLDFSEVTPIFLQRYEDWMIKNGASPTTIGIYLRSVRAVFNIAIEHGQIEGASYPFGKRKYVIPHSRNIKKALTKTEIDQIVAYVPEPDSIEEMYRDLWLFLYLANGMNVKDMLMLTGRNIDRNRLTFIRAKTARSTKKAQKPVQVFLLPLAAHILDKWGNSQADSTEYLFPFLKHGADEQWKLAQIKQVTKQINKYMRRVKEKLEIEKDITTYTARHSFSTILSRSGAPIEYISESLGHNQISTTEQYLDSFEDEMKQKWMEELI